MTKFLVTKFLGEATVYRHEVIKSHGKEREALVIWGIAHTNDELLEVVKSLPKDGYPSFWVVMEMNQCIVGNAEYTLRGDSINDPQIRLQIDYERGACQGLSELFLHHYPLWEGQQED